MHESISLAILANSHYEDRSQKLAKQLSIPLCHEDHLSDLENPCESFDFILEYVDNKKDQYPRLTLANSAGTLGKAISIDFSGGKSKHRRLYGGGRGQPLAKAIGLKGNSNPTVIDATAGMGKDAFVLACLGADVTLIERSPILSALLENGIERASHDSDISEIITRQMRLITTDAIEWITKLSIDKRPDVIYMDPMYPHRNKSSLVKKEMRLLRELVGDDEDASQLLFAALNCAKKRVTVKRPRNAPILGGHILQNRKPSSTVESKNTRYDIYVP